MTNKSPADRISSTEAEASRWCGIPRRDRDDGASWPAIPLEELAAMLAAERRGEYRAPRCDRYLDNDGEARVEGVWRHRICEWYYEVVDQYGFDREVVGIALSCLDRYVQRAFSGAPAPRDAFQLAAITALHLVIKTHVTLGQRGRSRALAGLRRGHFHRPRDLDRMELRMLETLGWRVNPPTMHQFALRYTMLHPQGAICERSSGYLHDATCYQAELAMFLPHLMERFAPSVLAYAAMLNASDMFDYDELSPEVREEWLSLLTHPSVKMSPNEVQDAREKLRRACPALPSVDDFAGLRGGDDRSQQRRTRPRSPRNVSEFKHLS